MGAVAQLRGTAPLGCRGALTSIVKLWLRCPAGALLVPPGLLRAVSHQHHWAARGPSHNTRRRRARAVVLPKRTLPISTKPIAPARTAPGVVPVAANSGSAATTGVTTGTTGTTTGDSAIANVARSTISDRAEKLPVLDTGAVTGSPYMSGTGAPAASTSPTAVPAGTEGRRRAGSEARPGIGCHDERSGERGGVEKTASNVPGAVLAHSGKDPIGGVDAVAEVPPQPSTVTRVAAMPSSSAVSTFRAEVTSPSYG